jgi:F0F1-type ATP synthase beta subunit
MQTTDFHVLSELEHRHIVETVRETLRTLREVDEYVTPMDAHIEELQEVLRILGVDEMEEHDEE